MNIKYFALDNLPRLLMQILYALIFAFITYLCGVPVGGIIYAVIICAVMEFIFLAASYYRCAKKHRELTLQIKSKAVAVDELPEPGCHIERDYDELVRTLHRDRAKIVAENSSEKNDMINYYTMWVHQIKTPISAMHLIMQNEDAPIIRELNAELFRIEQYVEMVLAYLRMGSQSTDYVIKKRNLGKLVRQCLRKFSPIFIYKKISLKADDITEDVLTDEKWLCFVIEQILSNSLKYTRSGSISITSECVEDEVSLIISDTGIGIDPCDLPRIFDKGFTGYNGRLDKKASGLGLYLSKQILDRLNHGISIESQPGNGTSVKIIFYQNSELPLE